MTEKFNLRWSDFQTNTSKSFGVLRNETYLHDVTLVSDDYKHIEAHKFVLSSSSDFFKNMFQQTKQTQPILCLDGVNSQDLQNILDYVYDGEVKIQQEDLERFLKIAHRLKLKGLIASDFFKNAKDESKGSVSVKEETYNIESYETAPVQQPQQPQQPKPKPTTQRVAKSSSIFETESDEQEHKKRLKESLTRQIDGSFSCNICGKIFSGKNPSHSAKRHVEVHIEGLNYYCALCGHTFRSKNSYSTHTCFRNGK